MGLSASSLRIAMLTARKSSLEFEGQQINQQRLTLSNQSAALFNSMLTMQVPTPPDPSEFSRMVYTFDKGSGLSTILNVGRNMSGGYTHDVLYKSPKTDSVLMKKQLNNVGFRFENNQMSAVIDGMNYNLTLNGNKEKLDEYLKTKETYDNIKDIETQMQTLWKMSPNKELTSSQMKQYFETLGLSSVETPQAETVSDVQNTDDAFQNVYNNGNAYSYQDVALTYNASTPPFTLDPSKRMLLKQSGNQGTLTMGSDNKHYTYTAKVLPNRASLDSDITYNIAQDDNGNWEWSLNNVSGDVLEVVGIEHSQEEKYGTINNDEFCEISESNPYTSEGIEYTRILNSDGNYKLERDFFIDLESLKDRIEQNPKCFGDDIICGYFTSYSDLTKVAIYISGIVPGSGNYFLEVNKNGKICIKTTSFNNVPNNLETIENLFGGVFTNCDRSEYNENGYAYRQYDENNINKEGTFEYYINKLGIDVQTSQSKEIEDLPEGITKQVKDEYTYTYGDGKEEAVSVGDNQSATIAGYSIKQQNNDKFQLSGQGLPIGVEAKSADDGDGHQYRGTSNGVSYTIQDKGAQNSGGRYEIHASFKAWVTGNSDTWNNDEQQNGYRYNPQSHSLTLTTPTGVIAQMLFRNDKNQRGENDKNITVGEMLDFYEAILNQFGLYGSTTAYKTKLDKARSDYLATLDAKGVENPGENQALFNFIDANGKTAYLFVPLDCINKNSQVDSTYAYMYETSYLDGQTETISQKANIVYDENGRIAKITFDDGTVVIPEVKVEQDEEAYNAAMVKYDYEKQLYDKEIQDINTKTEIIAQQDKNLEIKLKSIDTQHTAIQTELEALNKVLDNNVKSSFGTFTA